MYLEIELDPSDLRVSAYDIRALISEHGFDLDEIMPEDFGPDEAARLAVARGADLETFLRALEHEGSDALRAEFLSAAVERLCATADSHLLNHLMHAVFSAALALDPSRR